MEQIKNSTFENTITLSSKSNNDKIFLKKPLFSCIVCLSVSLNFFELSCCQAFICGVCFQENKSPKSMLCPHCKRPGSLSPSKTAQSIILESYSVCPVCKIKDKTKNLIAHFENEHFGKPEDIQKLTENEELFLAVLDKYKIESAKKFMIHRHILTLDFQKNKDFACHIGSNTSHKNCIVNKKETEIDLKLIQCEENKREKLIEQLFYTCEDCNYDFCFNCASLENLSLKAKIHDHPLKLCLRNDGWRCDASYMQSRCASGFDEYYRADGVPRFRCVICNYDLCEKDIFKHFDYVD